MSRDYRYTLKIARWEWDAWVASCREWEAANPVRHLPHEVCDCVGQPQVPHYRPSSHCAARGSYAEWEPVGPVPVCILNARLQPAPGTGETAALVYGIFNGVPPVLR